MPPRTMTARLFVAAALLGLAGCAAFATPGEELWPYDYGFAEGPNDPPRLLSGDAPEQMTGETAPQ